MGTQKIMNNQDNIDYMNNTIINIELKKATLSNKIEMQEKHIEQQQEIIKINNKTLIYKNCIINELKKQKNVVLIEYIKVKREYYMLIFIIIILFLKIILT
jgi:hypothetical protein